MKSKLSARARVRVPCIYGLAVYNHYDTKMIPSKLGWNVDINRGLYSPPPMDYHGGTNRQRAHNIERQRGAMDRPPPRNDPNPCRIRGDSPNNLMASAYHRREEKDPSR